MTDGGGRPARQESSRNPNESKPKWFRNDRDDKIEVGFLPTTEKETIGDSWTRVGEFSFTQRTEADQFHKIMPLFDLHFPSQTGHSLNP